jgi:Chlamydia polymorphic membrane protein (Chlamydia_PMP) repeat
VAVNGNATSRVLHIGSGRTVTISGMTITYGYAYGESGGGIYNDHATLTLSNCTISGNFSRLECCDEWCDCNYGGLGGAIYNDYASVTITNCTISSNSADSEGAASIITTPC